MARPDATTAHPPSTRESRADWITFRLKDLPGTLRVYSDSTPLDYEVSRFKNIQNHLNRFNPDAYKLVTEMAETFAKSARVLRIYVDNEYSDNPKVTKIGFCWSHEGSALYRQQEFVVQPDGALMVKDNSNGNHPDFEPADPKTFLNHFKQFVENSDYAHGELSGHAAHLAHLKITVTETT